MNTKPHIAEWQIVDRPFSQPLLPFDTLQIRVNDQRFPYLGYVIPHLSYNCAILRRLKCSYMNLPVKYAQGYWHMDQQLVERWLELQMGLIAVINILVDKFELLLPPYYETYPLPSSYGFQNGRIREKQIRTAAMHAKAAFGPLVATCSYIISKTSKFTEPHARWQQCLIDNGVHPQWVEELSRSPITDFSPDAHRVGVIITPAFKFQELFPRLLLANVPTWILWDEPDDYANTKTILLYKPTPGEVWAAQALAATTSQHIPSTLSNPSASQILPGTAPQVQSAQGFGQLPGETWERFLNRRNERMQRKIATEGPLDRERRMNRERAASSHQLPGRKNGTKVYMWQPQEDHTFIRVLLTRLQVEDEWENFADSQRLFNGVENEWDMGACIDPSAEAPDYDYDSEAFISDYMGTSSIPDPIKSHAAHDPISHPNWDSDLQTAYQPRPEEITMKIHHTLQVIMEERCGFICPVAWYQPVQGWERPAAAKTWKFTCNTIGDVDAETPWNENLEHQLAVMDFVGKILHKAPIPPSLSDLDHNNNDRVEPITLEHKYLAVKTLSCGSTVFYRILPQMVDLSAEPKWDLIVPDALTALECIRWSRYSEMGRHAYVDLFRASGIPFSTRYFTENAPEPKLFGSDSARGLGWRAEHYLPSAADFIAYEAHRHAFLRSDRGRAAILKGGIVWRLACDSVDDEIIQCGPCDIRTSSYNHFHGDQWGSWDDKLTDEELDLICGVYKVRTGQGEQGSDSSWWPKHSAWEGSGLNIGCWTPDCERWYQRRLELLRSGKGTLKTAKQWREAVKMWKPTKHFVEEIRKRSAAKFPAQ